MSQAALVMEHVSKKFQRGELYDSLRDLVPGMLRRWARRRGGDTLGSGEFWALQDVSFEVQPGEAFGIVGANGAGKSTILKILSRILRPTLGTMAVRGRLSALIEVGAGFHPDLTGRENVYLNGTILGMSREEIRHRFDEIVEFSDLSEFIDTPVKRYSSGMFARLGFAVAAHVNPDILIVDEVLSVGDYLFQRKCLQRMNAVLTGGATVVFVSHDLRAMTELCRRALLLERGRVAIAGSTTDVVRTYLDRALDARHRIEGKAVHISRVTVRGPSGEGVAFQSGEKVWVDVEVRATAAVARLAVVLELTDDSNYRVFNTSTERLGTGSFSLEPGQDFLCTFELDLHLAQGTFHLGAYLHRYDVQQEYDRWTPAATLFISCAADVRGAVNLNPVVVAFRRP